MTFANPWGLLGLLALPTIAIIHLYHRRFPLLLVAGAHLWGAETQVRSPGRRRERLPITATLLLELLAALLLTIVLSQPRWGDLGNATHLVVVLDNSASMMAKPTNQPSFRDQAINTLEKRVNSLTQGSVVTLVLTGRRPVMLAGPQIKWEEAKPLLATWKPTATRHEFQSAWDLAAQLAEESGELLFLTDRVPEKNVPVPAQMEIVAVGQKLENAAISAARWTYDTKSNQGHIFLRISNYGTKPANVTISGKAGERPIFQKKTTVAKGSEIPLETNVAGGLAELTITLESASDGLAIDNQVTLIEPKFRILTLATTLPKKETTYRQIERVLNAIPNLQFGNVDDAHLIIASANALPESRPDLWWLGVGPIDKDENAQKNGKDLIGPYLIEKRNPLLDGVILGGVVWGGVQPTTLNVTPLISAGSLPLLAQLNETQTTAYLLNINLERSNLSESPDWPILLSNLVQLRRDNLPGLRRWNYRLNEDIQFRLSEGEPQTDDEKETELVLVHGEKTRSLARTTIVEVPQLDETGIYTVRDGQKDIGQFAVNFFDDDESKLVGLREGFREPKEHVDTAGFILEDDYTWLIMLGIVLIMLIVIADWYVLKPKTIIERS